MVKYLDGLEALANWITGIASLFGVESRIDFEARDVGYYAVHVYVFPKIEIPRQDWDNVTTTASIEIQIATQLQEGIRQLLHKYYEENREKPGPSRDWKWDYKSSEFSANYIGHILHYIEAMILDVREKQRSEKEQ